MPVRGAVEDGDGRGPGSEVRCCSRTGPRPRFPARHGLKAGATSAIARSMRIALENHSMRGGASVPISTPSSGGGAFVLDLNATCTGGPAPQRRSSADRFIVEEPEDRSHEGFLPARTPFCHLHGMRTRGAAPYSHRVGRGIQDDSRIGERRSSPIQGGHGQAGRKGGCQDGYRRKAGPAACSGGVVRIVTLRDGLPLGGQGLGARANPADVGSSPSAFGTLSPFSSLFTLRCASPCFAASLSRQFLLSLLEGRP